MLVLSERLLLKVARISDERDFFLSRGLCFAYLARKGYWRSYV